MNNNTKQYNEITNVNKIKALLVASNDTKPREDLDFRLLVNKGLTKCNPLQPQPTNTTSVPESVFTVRPELSCNGLETARVSQKQIAAASKSASNLAA